MKILKLTKMRTKTKNNYNAMMKYIIS